MTKNLILNFLIKSYLFLIIGFYPVAFIYKDEYHIPLIKLEGMVSSMFLGLFCNIGLILVLTDFGLRQKILTGLFLVLSVITSWLIFYLPAVNPASSLSDESWQLARQFLSYGSSGFIFIVMICKFREKK